MKYFSLCVLLLAPFNLSCIFESGSCFCTTEFREYRARVIDNNGQPIDSLRTRTTNKNGVVLYFTDSCNTPDWLCKAGWQIVLADGVEKHLSLAGDTLNFHAYSRNVDLNAKYVFNTDPCRCHVQKISGPDTLIAP